MMISDLLQELSEIEDQHGDLTVELDSGTEATIVDLIYLESSDHEPVAVVVR